jgi:chemotaxis protein CheX
MIDGLSELVHSAVVEAFDTMLKIAAVNEPDAIPRLNGALHVAGSVGFIGRLTGAVHIHSTAAFARRITGQIVGVSQEEVNNDKMVNDTIGELSNMIVGHTKSRLSDRGFPCSLTIPSIVRGTNFKIEPVSNTTRKVCTFRCQQDPLIVEVLLKSSRI